MCKLRGPLVIWVLTFILSLGDDISAQQFSFNADSAYAYLNHLAVDIGPRPMGSHNERAALKWVRDKFEHFGSDAAFVMPITAADGINTTSGVAVGIFNGASDSSIVIGGHIDSDSRLNPGANDDASGIACVLELARVWSSRSRHYTLIFAAFGGEEEGLAGSFHFVDAYPDIANVVLMLQIDMAGDDDSLIPFIDPVPGLSTSLHQAPAWLVKDAYEIDRGLGYNSLEYTTHFFSLNSAIGMAASDHIPFLDRGIPAIDFTAGINTSPIHTQRDRMSFISKNALARSGRIVHGLLMKYNSEHIRAERRGDYMLVSLFAKNVFLPSSLLILFNILTVFTGLVAFLVSRKNRQPIPRTERVRFSGWKLFFMMLALAIGAQLGEATMQLLKGLRYPWLAPVTAYLWLAALSFMGGLWIVLQWSHKWRFSPDPAVYSHRALIVLFVFILLLSLVSARLTVYPAATLLLFSAAVLVRNRKLKFLFVALSPWPMFRLMFMETLPFLRAVSGLGFDINTFFKSLLVSAVLTTILTIWFLPVLYGMGYGVMALPAFKNALKRFRSPAIGLVVLAVLVGYGSFVYSRPSYSDRWRASIVAEAEYDLRSHKAGLTITSNEYLRHTWITTDSAQYRYDSRINAVEPPVVFRADWFWIDGGEAFDLDEVDLLKVGWQITTIRPWYYASLSIETDSSDIREVETELAHDHDGSTVYFAWYHDPADTLRINASLRLQPGTRIIRKVTASYGEMPMPVEIESKYADVTYRTTVTYQDTLQLPMGQTTDAEVR